MSLGPQEDPVESQSGCGGDRPRFWGLEWGNGAEGPGQGLYGLEMSTPQLLELPFPHCLSPDPRSTPSLLPHSQIKRFPASLCPVALEGRVGSWTVLPVPKEAGVSLLPMLQRGADHFGMWSWQPLAPRGRALSATGLLPSNRGVFLCAAQAGCARIHLLLSPCPEPYCFRWSTAHSRCSILVRVNYLTQQ